MHFIFLLIKIFSIFRGRPTHKVFVKAYMNKQTCFLIISLGFFFSPLIGQTKKLEKTQFQNEIINQWWSNENKETVKDCDMRIFVIKSSEFEMNCINWTDGFSGQKCNYELFLKDNFFALNPVKCQNSQSPGFIYGYLSEKNQLYLLISKKALELNSNLLNQKNWMLFEKIKR